MSSTRTAATLLYTSPLPAPLDSKPMAYPFEASAKPAEHLKTLRDVVQGMQDDLNKHLTEIMEEEKKVLEKSNKPGVTEEDENKYGEEEAGEGE